MQKKWSCCSLCNEVAPNWPQGLKGRVWLHLGGYPHWSPCVFQKKKPMSSSGVKRELSPNQAMWFLCVFFLGRSISFQILPYSFEALLWAEGAIGRGTSPSNLIHHQSLRNASSVSKLLWSRQNCRCSDPIATDSCTLCQGYSHLVLLSCPSLTFPSHERIVLVAWGSEKLTPLHIASIQMQMQGIEGKPLTEHCLQNRSAIVCPTHPEAALYDFPRKTLAKDMGKINVMLKCLALTSAWPQSCRGPQSVSSNSVHLWSLSSSRKLPSDSK